MRFYNKFWRVLVLCGFPLVLIVPELAMLIMTMSFLPCLLIGIGSELALCFARSRTHMYRAAAILGTVLAGLIFWSLNRSVSTDLIIVWVAVGFWLTFGWAEVVWAHERKACERYPQGKPPLRRWATYVFAVISTYVLTASLIGYLMHTPAQTVVAERGQTFNIRYFRPTSDRFIHIEFALPEKQISEQHREIELKEEFPIDIRAVIDGRCKYRWHQVTGSTWWRFNLYLGKNSDCQSLLTAGFHNLQLQIVDIPEPLLNQPFEWRLEYPINFKYMDNNPVYVLLRPIVIYQPIPVILWLIYFLWFICRKFNK